MPLLSCCFLVAATIFFLSPLSAFCSPCAFAFLPFPGCSHDLLFATTVSFLLAMCFLFFAVSWLQPRSSFCHHCQLSACHVPFVFCCFLVAASIFFLPPLSAFCLPYAFAFLLFPGCSLDLLFATTVSFLLAMCLCFFAPSCCSIASFGAAMIISGNLN